MIWNLDYWMIRVYYGECNTVQKLKMCGKFILDCPYLIGICQCGSGRAMQFECRYFKIWTQIFRHSHKHKINLRNTHIIVLPRNFSIKNQDCNNFIICTQCKNRVYTGVLTGCFLHNSDEVQCGLTCNSIALFTPYFFREYYDFFYFICMYLKTSYYAVFVITLRSSRTRKGLENCINTPKQLITKEWYTLFSLQNFAIKKNGLIIFWN